MSSETHGQGENTPFVALPYKVRTSLHICAAFSAWLGIHDDDRERARRPRPPPLLAPQEEKSEVGTSRSAGSSENLPLDP